MQSIPLAADSTKVRRSKNNDGTVKHEQKRDSGEDNLQTSPKTTESAKLLKSGSNDVNPKHVQPWGPLGHLIITKVFVTSSWIPGHEVLGHPRYLDRLGKNREHHCLSHQKRVCNYIHPKEHGPFPDRLKLPYSDEEELLSGYEEDASYIRGGCTAWVKADFETVFKRHVVDVRKPRAGVPRSIH